MKQIVIKDIDGSVIFSHTADSNTIRAAVTAAIKDDIDLYNVYFESENLSGVDFSNQDLSKAVFIKCNLNGANFKDAVVGGSTFIECDSKKANGFYFFSSKSYMCGDGDIVTYNKVEGIDGSEKSIVVSEYDKVGSSDKKESAFSFGCN